MRRHSRTAVVALVVAAVLLGVVAIFGMRALGDDAQPVDARPATSSSGSTASAVVAASADVEVPDLAGLSVKEAAMVLRSAGFSVVVAGGTVDSFADAKVVAQEPSSGTVVDQGGKVTVYPAGAAARGKRKQKRVPVVVIDPGHQERGDTTPEPVGPGAKETKVSATGGATGAVTEIPEYEIALQIANNLKAQLESRGIKVVMTRTVNDVSLSNSARAQIANGAKADLFVRIHGDGSPDESAAGACTLYPASNAWTKPIAADSKRAAGLIQSAVVASTGAVDRGTSARGDLAGFNWARVPSVLVECGFLSNPVEDRLLASPHYQDKLARGIADGVVAYLDGAE